MVERRTRTRATSATPAAEYGPDQVHQVAIGRLKPYPNNPRVNDHAIDAVAASIQDFGFRVPILLDANYTIVAGHTRWEASKRLGLLHVPCMFGTDMTPEQIQAYRLVDNKTAEMADWDKDRYAEEISALQNVGIDLTSYGWSEKDLEDIRSLTQASEARDAAGALSADPDAAPRTPRTRTVAETPTQTRIQFGSMSFLVGKPQFDAWMGQVSEANSGNRDRIIADLLGRLGMPATAPAVTPVAPQPQVAMVPFGQRTRGGGRG